MKWSKDCFLLAGTAASQVPEFKITNTKQGNVKLLKQLESGFKRTINWKKYQSKNINQVQVVKEQIDFLFYRLMMKMVENVISNIIFPLWK